MFKIQFSPPTINEPVLRQSLAKLTPIDKVKELIGPEGDEHTLLHSICHHGTADLLCTALTGLNPTEIFTVLSKDCSRGHTALQWVMQRDCKDIGTKMLGFIKTLDKDNIIFLLTHKDELKKKSSALEFALSYEHVDVIREQFSEDIIREIQPELEKSKKERGLT